MRISLRRTCLAHALTRLHYLTLMKVTVLAEFEFTDDTGTLDRGAASYHKELEMPGSPAGLTTIVLQADTLPVAIAISNVAWSEPAGGYVIQGKAKVTEYYRKTLEADERWLPWREDE